MTRVIVLSPRARCTPRISRTARPAAVRLGLCLLFVVAVIRPAHAEDLIPFFTHALQVTPDTGPDSGAKQAPVAATELPSPVESLPPGPGSEENTEAPTDGTAPKVIVIDPGHGGADSGETGVAGAKEKDIVLAVAHRLAEILSPTFTIVLTRSDDTASAPEVRTNLANSSAADLFISLHAGASGAAMANGFELFIPTNTTITPSGRTIAVAPSRLPADANRDLARCVAKALAEATSATDRGIHTAPCRVFRGLNVPGLLIEVGCLTNPTEESLLANGDYQGKIAQGIAAGIQAYLAATG